MLSSPAPGYVAYARHDVLRQDFDLLVESEFPCID